MIPRNRTKRSPLALRAGIPPTLKHKHNRIKSELPSSLKSHPEQYCSCHNLYPVLRGWTILSTHGLSSVSFPTVIASQAELKPSLPFKLRVRDRDVLLLSEKRSKLHFYHFFFPKTNIFSALLRAQYLN